MSDSQEREAVNIDFGGVVDTFHDIFQLVEEGSAIAENDIPSRVSSSRLRDFLATVFKKLGDISIARKKASKQEGGIDLEDKQKRQRAKIQKEFLNLFKNLLESDFFDILQVSGTTLLL